MARVHVSMEDSFNGLCVIQRVSAKHSSSFGDMGIWLRSVRGFCTAGYAALRLFHCVLGFFSGAGPARRPIGMMYLAPSC